MATTDNLTATGVLRMEPSSMQTMPRSLPPQKQSRYCSRRSTISVKTREQSGDFGPAQVPARDRVTNLDWHGRLAQSGGRECRKPA